MAIVSLPADVQSDPGARRQEIRALRAELDALTEDMRNVEAEERELLDAVHPDVRASAINLIHYLALRRHDLRALQPRLSALGLSSLGRSEARVLASVDAVRAALQALDSYKDGQRRPRRSTRRASRNCSAAHTQALLGPAPAERRVRIMVTMPTEAAHDYTLVHELVRSGNGLHAHQLRA